MNGAVELYKAAKKHGIKPIVGCEVYLVDDHTTARGAGARSSATTSRCSPRRRGLPQPRQALLAPASSRACSRGKPTVDLGLLDAPRRGRHRPDRLPGQPLLPAPRRRPRWTTRAPTPTTCSGIFGAENVYFEVQKNGLAAQDQANEGIVRIAREVGRPLVGTADVHYLRREDYHHHTALLCVQTKSTLADAEDDVRDERVLPQVQRGDGAARSPSGPRRCASTLEIAERCRRRDRARQPADPALPCPTARTSSAYLRERVDGGPARALRRPAPGRGDRARWRWSSRSSTAWASTRTS